MSCVLKSAPIFILAILPAFSAEAQSYVSCSAQAETLFQFEGYRVGICYENPNSGQIESGQGGIWVSNQGGLAWFFDRGNPEVLVKVLDGCAINDYRWVFAVAGTDVGFNLTVTAPDGRRKTYRNPRKTPHVPVQDVQAFACDGGTSPGPSPGDGTSRFGAGLHQVGSQVQPGRYYTNPGAGCYWERRSNDSDDLAGILANSFLSGDHAQEIVDVATTDRYFRVDEDCGQWSGSYRYPLGDFIAPGQWLVREQISPGTWRITDNAASGLCYWARLSAFSGEIDDIIDNGLIEQGEEVIFSIGEDDVGFSLDADCFGSPAPLFDLQPLPNLPVSPPAQRKEIERTLSIRDALRTHSQTNRP